MEESLEPQVPLLADGTPMKPFKVMMRAGKNGVVEKAIFIDNEMLDYSVDISSLMDAKKMGMMYFRAAQQDIEKHFTEAVSETIGRKVTADDIKQAIRTGWI